MSLTITQRPQQTAFGIDSDWNAVSNPILYKFQRKDYTFNQINSSGGLVQLQFSNVNYGSNFAAGDVIYIKSDNSTYAITATVLSSTFSTHTYILCDSPYIGAAPGGFTNNDDSRPSYYVEVKIYDSSNNALNSDAFAYTPDSTGLLTVNVASILRANLQADNTIDLTNTNIEMHNDSYAYKKFYLKYTEVWSGSYAGTLPSQQSDGGEQFFAILGARQIPSPYGGNMFEYTCFNTVDYTDAKFLTKLTTPVWWRGWPFVLSAIIDDSLSANLNIKVGADVTQFAGTQIGNAGRLVTCYFGFVSQGSIDGSSSSVITIVDDATKLIAYTEALSVELRDPCENGIMLMARNSLGGMLCWLFEVDQEYTFDYGNDIKAARKVLKANNLSSNEWDALQDFFTLGTVYRNSITEFSASVIKTSSRIGQQVYAVESNGTKTGVIVIPTRNKTNTRRRLHTFEIEIEYPEVFAP